MYKRDILPSRPSPVEEGNPIFGTWTKAFDDVNLLSIKHPFSTHLPKFIKKYRIKEWQSFQIQNDTYYLTVVVSNVRYFRIAQVFVWNKESKEKLLFRKVLPFGAWKLPRSLSNAAFTSRSYGFYIRIHNWLDADLIELDLDVEPTKKRPSFTAHLELDFARQKTTPMVTHLPFSERRSMYSFKTMTSVRGDLVFGGQHLSFSPERTAGLFFDYKGFFPYRMRHLWCNGFSYHEDKQLFGFSIAEGQTRDTFRYNENALWFKGELTPLPPVKITMPEGPESDWVIQDLEGMVDLTFTPQETIRFGFNYFVAHSEYIAPFGVYNGMLVTRDGIQIPVRNLWGTGEKLYLRV
ncbi:MAG TPA: DUF2804 domain-containing protein [Termitinemataceae bacterium]|nr:DUF2804 domain-containing protein [Termitinemataceae bacterium]HPQ01165.1 DUF2804 domain-containing protein [Termitinemataceae bacterium]